MGSRIKGEGGRLRTRVAHPFAPFAKGWDSYAARSPVYPTLCKERKGWATRRICETWGS